MIAIKDMIGMLEDQPFLMHPNDMVRVLRTVANRMSMGRPFESEVETREPGYRLVNGVAVISVHGVIDFRESMWTRWFGGTSCQGLTEQIHRALDDGEVSGLVFDIDSPGGVISGVPEVAELIFKSRDVKPSIAVANPMAASAAIWIGTACTKLHCFGSGRVGSIGSFILHEEWSRLLDEAGITVKIFRNPERKAERNVYEALTEQAEEGIQAEVNVATQQFEKAVAKYRGVSHSKVRSDFGQGKMFSAAEAKRIGLVDKVTGLPEAVSSMMSRKSSRSKANVLETNLRIIEKIVGNYT